LGISTTSTLGNPASHIAPLAIALLLALAKAVAAALAALVALAIASALACRYPLKTPDYQAPPKPAPLITRISHVELSALIPESSKNIVSS